MIWLLARLPDEYTIEGEHIEPYLVFSNSHDGSGSIKVAINTFFADMTNLESNAQRLSNEVGSMKFSDNITASTNNINAKFEDLLFKISQFREKNSKIKSDSKLNAQFDQLVNSINLSDHTVTAWKAFTQQFNELKNLATSKGALGRSLGDELSYIADLFGS